MSVHALMSELMCGGQRSHLWNQFSPSFTWDPGMELRQPGFTTATLRHLRCHQSPTVSLSFQFRHLPRAGACVCSSGWPFLGQMLLRNSQQRDCSIREKTEYGWPKASCYHIHICLVSCFSFNICSELLNCICLYSF